MNAIVEKGVDKLVSTEWVEEHLNDPRVRLVESNEDPLVYHSGHIPGAIEVDWIRDLNDAICRDYISADQFADLLSRAGIGPETEVIFYGDKNNWWAAYALWVFEMFGFTNSKIMDGGSLKWKNEGRQLTKEIPSFPAVEKQAWSRSEAPIRVLRDEVLAHCQAGKPIIDVRSPMEYTGERTHMEG